jgi:hypothetical protein
VTASDCGFVGLRVASTHGGAPVVTAGIRGGVTAWVDFGGGHLASSGAALGPPWDLTTGEGTAVAAFDTTGKYRWGKSSGTASTVDYASPIGVAASTNSVVLGGNFGIQGHGSKAPAGTTLVLGGSTLEAVGAGDVFIVHFPL